MVQVVKKQFVSKGGEWVELPTGVDTAAMDPMYVNVEGDTMTGPLVLSGDATADDGAITRQQLDLYTEKPVSSAWGLLAHTVVTVGVTSPIPIGVFTSEGLTSGGGGITLNRTGWYIVQANFIFGGIVVPAGARLLGDIMYDGRVHGRVTFGAAEDRVACTTLIYGTPGGVVLFNTYASVDGGVMTGDSTFAIHYVGDH